MTFAAPASAPRRARILKRADRDARAEAEAAERETLSDLDMRRAAAREEGYREGLEAAERAAAERGLALAMDAKAQVKAVEGALTSAVVRAVERVIGDIDSVALARRVARTALSEIRQAGDVAIHVAPDCADAVRNDVTMLQRQFPGFAVIIVTPDPAVAPGGAVLKTPAGVLDARIETQLRALTDSLEAAQATLDDTHDDGTPNGTLGPAPVRSAASA